MCSKHDDYLRGSFRKMRLNPVDITPCLIVMIIHDILHGENFRPHCIPSHSCSVACAVPHPSFQAQTSGTAPHSPGSLPISASLRYMRQSVYSSLKRYSFMPPCAPKIFHSPAPSRCRIAARSAAHSTGSVSTDVINTGA